MSVYQPDNSTKVIDELDLVDIWLTTYDLESDGGLHYGVDPRIFFAIAGQRLLYNYFVSNTIHNDYNA